SDPTAIASLTLQRHLNPYPKGDLRHVLTPDEQIEDLRKVTLAEIREFHQRFYGVSEGELVIAGQFEPAAGRKLVTELFGDWKSGVSYQRIRTPYRKIEPLTQAMETPDKQNATLQASLPLPMNDEDPDYPAMLLANYIFGGSPASRL